MPRISRGVKNARQQADQVISRQENGIRKRKERARREALLVELVKKGNFPYTPTIMSWLSTKLNKPSRYISEEDVKAVIK